MTLRWAAGAMDITPSYLSDLELGRRQWRKEMIDRMTKVVHP
jgi:predicted transcriptional regulator